MPVAIDSQAKTRKTGECWAEGRRKVGERLLTGARSHTTPWLVLAGPRRISAKKDPEAPPISRMRLCFLHAYPCTKALTPAQAIPIRTLSFVSVSSVEICVYFIFTNYQYCFKRLCNNHIITADGIKAEDAQAICWLLQVQNEFQEFCSRAQDLEQATGSGIDKFDWVRECSQIFDEMKKGLLGLPYLNCL